MIVTDTLSVDWALLSVANMYSYKILACLISQMFAGEICTFTLEKTSNFQIVIDSENICLMIKYGNIIIMLFVSFSYVK